MTRARIVSACIYWDTTVSDNHGWAWAVRLEDGESESGPAADVEDALSEVNVYDPSLVPPDITDWRRRDPHEANTFHWAV